MAAPVLRSGRTAELDPVTLYRILQLRGDVFVVEQRCAYPDLDGRDLEPEARHWWLEADGEVLAVLRVLTEPDGARRIGRVATAPAVRSRGLAAQLLGAALDGIAAGEVVLDAQLHLETWYTRFGFTSCGPEFLEDGIPHIPMRAELPLRPR